MFLLLFFKFVLTAVQLVFTVQTVAHFVANISAGYAFAYVALELRYISAIASHFICFVVDTVWVTIAEVMPVDSRTVAAVRKVTCVGQMWRNDVRSLWKSLFF